MTRRHEDRNELDVIVGNFSIHSIPYFSLLDNGFTYSNVASTVSGGLEIPIEAIGLAVTIQSPVENLVDVSRVYCNYPF